MSQDLGLALTPITPTPIKLLKNMSSNLWLLVWGGVGGVIFFIGI